MMIQPVDTTQQTFGMALRKPSTRCGMENFTRYVKIGEPCTGRGLKQFIKKQLANPYDIVVDEAASKIHVLNPKNSIIKSFQIKGSKPAPETKMTFSKVMKGLWYMMAKPEKALPSELLAAGKYADSCNKELIRFNKSVEKTEKIFDSIVPANVLVSDTAKKV